MPAGALGAWQGIVSNSQDSACKPPLSLCLARLRQCTLCLVLLAVFLFVLCCVNVFACTLCHACCWTFLGVWTCDKDSIGKSCLWACVRVCACVLVHSRECAATHRCLSQRHLKQLQDQDHSSSTVHAFVSGWVAQRVLSCLFDTRSRSSHACLHQLLLSVSLSVLLLLRGLILGTHHLPCQITPSSHLSPSSPHTGHAPCPPPPIPRRPHPLPHNTHTQSPSHILTPSKPSKAVLAWLHSVLPVTTGCCCSFGICLRP